MQVWWMQDEADLKPLVPSCRGDHKPLVNLSKLPPAKKQRVWALIKEHAPALAALLSSASTQHHQASFDVAVLVYREDLPWQVLELINR